MHLQKSMRNALYNSGTNSSRQCKDLHDAPFGWATINALFVNNQLRFWKKTALLDDSVKLSGWSKMNVGLSKVPFEVKILLMNSTRASANHCNLQHQKLLPSNLQ
jgi:hypothetical protein